MEFPKQQYSENNIKTKTESWRSATFRSQEKAFSEKRQRLVTVIYTNCSWPPFASLPVRVNTESENKRLGTLMAISQCHIIQAYNFLFYKSIGPQQMRNVKTCLHY